MSDSKLIIEKSLRKVLIVTDKTIVDLSLMDNMLKAADEAGLEYVIFDKVDPNPTSDNVEEGLAMYKSGGCEGMIAFGGGSPMDCAKAIGARVARPKEGPSASGDSEGSKETAAYLRGTDNRRHRVGNYGCSCNHG